MENVQLKEAVLNDFIAFCSTTYSIDNILDFAEDDDFLEEAVNEYFTDKFYEAEDEDDINELNEAEKLLRNELGMEVIL